MNTILTILAVIVLLVILAGLFYILFKIQMAMCEDCPLRDKCLNEKLEMGNGNLPSCMAHFNSPNNNFFN